MTKLNETVPFGSITYQCCRLKTCKRCGGKGSYKRTTYKLKRFLDEEEDGR